MAPMRKGRPLPKHSPWHVIDEDVHHNNSLCTAGNSYEEDKLRSGTGNKPLCKECKMLNAAGR